VYWLKAPLIEVAPAKVSELRFEPDTIVWHLTLDQIESQSGRILNKKYGYMNEAGTSTYFFDSGNVLYSKLRPYLNKVMCPDEPGVASTELVPLRPNTDLLDRHYLMYYLRSSHFLNFANVAVAGVKMPRIIMTKFWKHNIPLPSISEQRRIVEILDQAIELHRMRNEGDTKAERILPALFFKMFGDPATNPKDWETVSFHDAMADHTTRSGKIQRKMYKASGSIPVIDQGEEFIAGYSDDSSLITNVDDPVIVFGDHTRNVKLVEFPFIIGADGAKVLVPKTGFTPGYLAAHLKASPIPNLGYSRHMRVVKQLVFMKPPLDLQNKYEEYSRAVSSQLKGVESIRRQLDRLSKSLSHLAFVGDLSAKWRDAHMEELLEEMEQQAKLLGSDKP